MARPVVQVMRRAVAVTTFRELGMHCSRVRFTVAIAALGHRLVLVNVTGHASHLVMLGLAGSQLAVSRVVTGRTIGRDRAVGARRVTAHALQIGVRTLQREEGMVVGRIAPGRDGVA